MRLVVVLFQETQSYSHLEPTVQTANLLRQNMTMTFAAELPNLLREIDHHVSSAGWDQPARLFALVPNAALVEAGVADQDATGLGAVEQEIEPTANLEELLESIAWPAEVLGALVVLERIVLPPEVQEELAALSEVELINAVTNHPKRSDVRLFAAALRSGEHLNAIRQRAHDEPADLAIAEDLVPNLNAVLLATFLAE